MDEGDPVTAAEFTRRLGELHAAEHPVPMRSIFALAKGAVGIERGRLGCCWRRPIT